jgi:hypothetical protein
LHNKKHHNQPKINSENYGNHLEQPKTETKLLLSFAAVKLLLVYGIKNENCTGHESTDLLLFATNNTQTQKFVNANTKPPNPKSDKIQTKTDQPRPNDGINHPLVTIIRHIIMRFFGIFVTFVTQRKKTDIFELISAYSLYFIIGLLSVSPIIPLQTELFAQNDTLNEFNESGAVILKRSIDTISRFIRVECNVRMLTFVDGIEFSADGKYEEQSVTATTSSLEKNNNGNNSEDAVLRGNLSEFQRTMYRQELYFTMDTLSVQTEPNRIILVCYPNKNDSKNGNIWQFKSINGIKTLNQINIDAVEAAIKKSRGVGVPVGVSESRMFTQVGMLWNVGGMCGVLGQIDRFYEFGELPKPETVDGVKVFKLAGSMRKAYFDILLQNHGGLDKNNRYPSNLPCNIEVHIGVNDSFPYKIRYLNRKTANTKATNLLVEINYSGIIINGSPIPEHRFSTFQNEIPAGVNKIDSSTEQYIKSLGLQ